MIIKGLKKEITEVEVDDSVIKESYLLLIRRRLPFQIRNLDLFVENGELFFWNEVIGHNRDFEKTKVKDEYPDLKITNKIIKIVEFCDLVENF